MEVHGPCERGLDLDWGPPWTCLEKHSDDNGLFIILQDSQAETQDTSTALPERPVRGWKGLELVPLSILGEGSSGENNVEPTSVCP